MARNNGSYDETKDILIRGFEPLDLGEGMQVQAGVYSYDGGTERLRVNLVGQGKRNTWTRQIAKIDMDTDVVARHVIALIKDAFELED